MHVVVAAAVAVVVCCLPPLSLLARRSWLARGGSVSVSLRCPRHRDGRRWVVGLGRYDAERLLWFRLLSLAPRARVTLPRRGISVRARRAPTGPERGALRPDVVVLDCSSDNGPLEIALPESALPGFLAWLESAPPGVPARR